MTLNFLSHARNHMDRPWAVIGTAVPDLFTMSDRRSRIRVRDLPDDVSGLDPITRDLLEGVRAHLEDDRWFHQSAAFHEVTTAIAQRIRTTFPGESRLRASVLAHIGMEMLIDSELCRRDPSLLQRYYLALSVVVPQEVSDRVNRWADRPALRLPWVIRFFRGARFMASYMTDEGFTHRLSQVSMRVKMGPLPPTFPLLAPELRAMVAEAADALLTPPASEDLAPTDDDPSAADPIAYG